jgi:hypothetical protein
MQLMRLTIFAPCPHFVPKSMASFPQVIRETPNRGPQMTKLLQYIEEMRARVLDVASSEKVVVKALADALDRLDTQLMREVRTITSEHEARRAAILGELHGLAAGIGMFQPLQSAPAPEALPTYRTDGAHQTIVPGDWRAATRNIEEELEMRLNGRAHPN